MTELLDGAAEVRTAANGELAAVRLGSVWREVTEVALGWRVETDWWRSPVRRDYVRCLLAGGECVDLYCDLETGAWRWARRHD
jgi:hypothetical protein